MDHRSFRENNSRLPHAEDRSIDLSSSVAQLSCCLAYRLLTSPPCSKFQQRFSLPLYTYSVFHLLLLSGGFIVSNSIPCAIIIILGSMEMYKYQKVVVICTAYTCYIVVSITNASLRIDTSCRIQLRPHNQSHASISQKHVVVCYQLLSARRWPWLHPT